MAVHDLPRQRPRCERLERHQVRPQPGFRMERVGSLGPRKGLLGWFGASPPSTIILVTQPRVLKLGRNISTLPYTTYHLHLLVMAIFASLVGPFGGFFASGFKRAFNIKDFGHSIPGHGGMTDRMDCQCV